MKWKFGNMYNISFENIKHLLEPRNQNQQPINLFYFQVRESLVPLNTPKQVKFQPNKGHNMYEQRAEHLTKKQYRPRLQTKLEKWKKKIIHNTPHTWHHPEQSVFRHTVKDIFLIMLACSLGFCNFATLYTNTTL